MTRGTGNRNANKSRASSNKSRAPLVATPQDKVSGGNGGPNFRYDSSIKCQIPADISVSINNLTKEYQINNSQSGPLNKKQLAWTRGGVIATVIYTFLTIFSVGASIYAAVAARQSFTAVQRAFVSSPGLKFVNVGTAEKPRWSAGVLFRNNGATPTDNLSILLLVGGAAQGEEEPWAIDIRRSGTAPISALLGPKEDYSLMLPPADSLLNEGTGATFIYGVVDYKDVFPSTKPHFTEYCFRFIGLAGKVSLTSPTFSYCPHHNCSDDQCYLPQNPAPATNAELAP